MRERRERGSLWGVQRRKDTDGGDGAVHAGDASPKQQHVLDLQRSAGNAAVAGAVVQRSLWGDDEGGMLGGVGSMFAPSSEPSGPEAKGMPVFGMGPDTAKGDYAAGPHGGPSAGHDGGAGKLGDTSSGVKGFEPDQVGPADAAAKGYGANEVDEDEAAAKGSWGYGFDDSGNDYKDPAEAVVEENEVSEDDAGAKGYWDGGFDTTGNEYKDPVGSDYETPGAAGGAAGGESEYGESYK